MCALTDSLEAFTLPHAGVTLGRFLHQLVVAFLGQWVKPGGEWEWEVHIYRELKCGSRDHCQSHHLVVGHSDNQLYAVLQP